MGATATTVMENRKELKTKSESIVVDGIKYNYTIFLRRTEWFDNLFGSADAATFKIYLYDRLDYPTSEVYNLNLNRNDRNSQGIEMRRIYRESFLHDSYNKERYNYDSLFMPCFSGTEEEVR